MLKQIEGSQAVAEAVALCRPEVICAYPISPQTHIVEGLGELVKERELTPCEFINVESEFAAMSVAIGSSRPPARAPTPPPPARACCSWPRRSTTRRAWACRS
jgi:pyruvate ferredoxin oxidoreductase alpha subunit